jgi:protein-L-isoaspartate O-methyltransferase
MFLACAAVAVAQPRYSDYSTKLAPFVPSPQPIVERMLELASVKPGDTVFDLGCGDGRVIVTAAQRYKAKALGIEISDKLVRQANDQIARMGLGDRAKAVQGDIREADLTGADVVVMYLLTGANAEIRPRLEKYLKPGARVVSYAYAVPGWKPAKVDRTDEKRGRTIYLYEMPPVPAR